MNDIFKLITLRRSIIEKPVDHIFRLKFFYFRLKIFNLIKSRTTAVNTSTGDLNRYLRVYEGREVVSMIVIGKGIGLADVRCIAANPDREFKLSNIYHPIRNNHN